MTQTNTELFLDRLAQIAQLSPDIRLGQLLANIDFLAESRAGQSLWDIEDTRLLELLNEHQEELMRRVSTEVSPHTP